MKATGWLKGLRVTADGTGVVSHAGVALLRALADNLGLTSGLSRALASDRLLVRDRDQVLADLACAIADGAEVISDFRVIGDRADLFGLVASVPTAWRTLDEIAGGGQRALALIAPFARMARSTNRSTSRQGDHRKPATERYRRQGLMCQGYAGGSPTRKSMPRSQQSDDIADT